MQSHAASVSYTHLDVYKREPKPKQYVSGETFYLLGRGVRLSVEKNVRDTIFNDGVYLHLQTKDPDDFSKKQRLVTAYLDEQCLSLIHILFRSQEQI